MPPRSHVIVVTWITWLAVVVVVSASPHLAVRRTVINSSSSSSHQYDKAHGRLNAYFRCLDGQLPEIRASKVCDGVLDCEDLSDECLCSTLRNPICSQLILGGAAPSRWCAIRCSNSSTCVGAHQVCDGRADCPHGDDERFCPYPVTCRDVRGGAAAVACDGVATCGDASDECGRRCWNEPPYCNVTSSPMTWLCANVTRIGQLCDGVVDCRDGSDEARCPASSHFYCATWDCPGKGCGQSGKLGGKPFTTYDRRFDGSVDCPLGDDECPPRMRGFVDDIIKDQGTRVIKWVTGTVAFLGNAAVIWATWLELSRDHGAGRLGRQAKCNRVFVLNLAVADFLMGVQMLSHSVINEIYVGRFCLIKNKWLSSQLCVMLGVMSQVSAQQSVFILVLMTSYRLYGTLRPFQAEDSPLIARASVFLAISWVVSVVLALVPQASLFSDFFTNEYWLPLPFWTDDRLKRAEAETFVTRLSALQPNRTSVAALDWNTMVSYIEDTVHLRPIHRHWAKTHNNILLYNRRPPCQLYLYPTSDEAAWQYVTALISFDFAAMIFIVGAYVIIYRASSRPSMRKSVRRKSRQWRRDNAKMQRRVLFIVATDVCCWLPICVGSVMTNCGWRLHPRYFEYTTSLLLPLNSALNPIVYSSLFQRTLASYRRRRRGGRDSSDLLDDSNDSSNPSSSHVGIIGRIRASLASLQTPPSGEKRLESKKPKGQRQRRRVGFAPASRWGSLSSSSESGSSSQAMRMLTVGSSARIGGRLASYTGLVDSEL